LKLRFKTLLYIGIALCVLITAFCTLSFYVILSSFNSIEENQAFKNAGRLTEIVRKELSRIETLANDWALWDDSYSFVGNGNPSFVDTNLQDQMIANLNINVLIFMDTAGKIIYGTAFDSVKKTKEPLSEGILESIAANKGLFEQKDEKGIQFNGILMTNDVPLLLAARSILTSKLEGPSRGVLIFGVYMDNAFVENAGKQIRRDFKLERADREMSLETAEALVSLKHHTTPVIKMSKNDMLSVFIPFADVGYETCLIANMTMVREIYKEGRTAFLTFAGGILVTGGVIYLLIVFILERAVLGKIRNFTEIFGRIRQVSDLTLRVDEKGGDEISMLGKEINKMLSALEQAKTTQQYTEISMVNNEKRYQLIIEQAPIGIVTCHLDERFRTVNKAFCDMLGYSAEELLQGKELKDVTFPQDYESAQKHFEEHLEKNLQTIRLEKRFVRKDARMINVLMLSQVYRDLLGDPQYIIATVQDITEQIEKQKRQDKLEEELRQSQQLESIGRLAGGFAHDLNNFLVPILGYTDMLIAETSKNDPLYNGFMEIKNSAERAKSLSQKFLALSSRQMLEVTTLDINDIIKSFKSILNRLIREDIKIEYRLSPDISMMKGDYTQIEQVIMNLAVNAKDAMLKGGVLSFETYDETLFKEVPDAHPPLKPGKYVVLKVTDTGTGISKAAMSHLFEAFYTTKERGKGTGLGLSMVHGIVFQHKGGIRVWTEEGKGTSFKIYLPASEDRPEQIKEKTVLTDETRRGNGEVVLIVEDEPSVLRIVSSELKRNGYDVIEAESGQAAIELVKDAQSRIDILLTDVIMPEMDGKELYKRLSEIRPDLKVLYMSGHTYDILSQHDIQAPDAQFISKPFSMEVLRTKINNLLDG